MASLAARPARQSFIARIARGLSRAVLGLLIALLALAAIGVVYQIAAEAADRRAFPPPGRLIDVGGHRLHINCVGEGQPTVVLDHVGAGNSAQWGLIQPQLAADVRVCAYDRAGFGWSEPSRSGAHDAATAARDLHTLLERAGEPGPFLIVGHSYGARVAKLFAAAYPEATAGLVLVDPGTIAGHPTVPPAIDAQWREGDSGFVTAARFLSRLGLIRIANGFGADGGTGELPAEWRATFYARSSATQTWDAIAAEGAAMDQTTPQELAITSLGDLPLLVLSADEPASPSRAAWTVLNGTVAGLSTRGEHRVIAGAAHMSFAWERQYADVVAAAVREQLAAPRAGQ